MFDIYTLIFLALAVFIFLRLRSVLGQRSGSERPPFDIPPSREAMKRSADTGNDNVVQLPPRSAEQASIIATAEAGAEETTPANRWKALVEEGSSAGAALDAIVKADSSFDPKHFVTGARAAYEMIVSAFAQGDRRTLKDLLSPDVYAGFEAAIKDRETRGETTETRFVSIDDAKLIDASVQGRNAQITLRFVSQIISATRDKNGAVVDGNAEKVTDVTDVWTFARDVSSRDPNWKLVGTEAAG